MMREWYENVQDDGSVETPAGQIGEVTYRGRKYWRAEHDGIEYLAFTVQRASEWLRAEWDKKFARSLRKS